MSVQKVGFIGLGMMGAPMCARIAGAGHALKLFGKEQVTLAYFGEGSASEGDVASALESLGQSKPPPPTSARCSRRSATGSSSSTQRLGRVLG